MLYKGNFHERVTDSFRIDILVRGEVDGGNASVKSSNRS